VTGNNGVIDERWITQEIAKTDRLIERSQIRLDILRDMRANLCGKSEHENLARIGHFVLPEKCGPKAAVLRLLSEHSELTEINVLDTLVDVVSSKSKNVRNTLSSTIYLLKKADCVRRSSAGTLELTPRGKEQTAELQDAMKRGDVYEKMN